MLRAGRTDLIHRSLSGGDLLLARMDPKHADVRNLNARDIRDLVVRNDLDFGWKGMVGARISPRLAFEAGYTDLGKATVPSITTRQASVARTKAFTAFGVGMMPVGKVDLFAKAGPVRSESTGRVDGTFFDSSQRRIGYGAGVQLARRRFVMRVEYEQFGNGAAGNLHAISLGFRMSLHRGQPASTLRAY
ncbi:MAG: hypothetical protein WDO12_06615 [Pseudomonadota bacterium]